MCVELKRSGRLRGDEASKSVNLLNKSCSSLLSMGVRFRCGTQEAKELRLNFLAVISYSASETKLGTDWE